MDIIQYIYIPLISARGTPLEVLHTLLLGPYKYLLRATMAKLSKNKQRTQLSALLSAFPSSGFTSRISRNIAKYYKSFVGRNFKALAQMALFVLSPFLAPAEASFIKGKHLSIYTIFPNSLYNTSCRCLKSLNVTESIQRVWVIMKTLFRILLLLAFSYFTEEVQNPLASSSS